MIENAEAKEELEQLFGSATVAAYEERRVRRAHEEETIGRLLGIGAE